MHAVAPPDLTLESRLSLFPALYHRLMGRASATIRVPGRASEAEALWYDPVRWPAWIDGFGHVVELAETWPVERPRSPGTASPAGRGRVLETRRRLRAARAGRRSRSRTAACAAPSAVAFTPGPDDVEVALTLDYELKERNPLTPLIDLLFIRRAVAAVAAPDARALRPRAARGPGVGRP